ncbi:MAG: hypothetical protein CO096_13355 [Armatimonadetes bacterium CG_4_9_14_3_um_filter_66_14]|nr:MAG: hypothetical protein CO096_13355 [Armatimonadetes bacterium CG_4_9_14_3_um_filter_66_14]
MSLAGEALQLYEEGAYDLVLSRVVADELEEVIDRDFPRARRALLAFLRPFADQLLDWPTPAGIRAVLPFAVDHGDAPIFASALAAQPDIVLSNDFETFHTPQAKDLWHEHGIEVESLYGLLCVFGGGKGRGQATPEAPEPHPYHPTPRRSSEPRCRTATRRTQRTRLSSTSVRVSTALRTRWQTSHCRPCQVAHTDTLRAALLSALAETLPTDFSAPNG